MARNRFDDHVIGYHKDEDCYRQRPAVDDGMFGLGVTVGVAGSFFFVLFVYLLLEGCGNGA